MANEGLIPEARFALLVDAMRAFAEEADDPDRLLALIARETAHVLDAYCNFAIPSEDGQWVRSVGAHDPDPTMQARLSSVFTSPTRRSEHPFASRFDDGVTHLLSSPVPLALLRARAPKMSESELAALELRATLFVAMKAKGETVGWLALCRHGAHASSFSESDLEIARSLADVAATNLVNARLLAQRDLEVARRSAVSDAARAFAAATGDEAELVHLVAKNIAEIFDGLCVLRRIIADGETLKTAGVHHPDPQILAEVEKYADLPMKKGQTVTGRVALSGVPLIVDESHPDAEAIRTGPFADFMKAAKITSTMCS